MLRLIGWVVKVAVFTAFVLVLGNWIRYDGKTLSDQVKTGMAHADPENLTGSLRGWAGRFTSDVRAGAKKAPRGPAVARNAESGTSSNEEIPPSERQKLKALIRDLNTP